MDVLPVKNGGPGIVLNVRAKRKWPGQGATAESVPTSLAPGDFADLVLTYGGQHQSDWGNNVVSDCEYDHRIPRAGATTNGNR